MARKNRSISCLYTKHNSEGRMVTTFYDHEKDWIVLYFSRRLTPEVMGEYRSVSDLNRERRCNFELSMNKRSLITIVPLLPESALALRKTLRKTLSASRPARRYARICDMTSKLQQLEGVLQEVDSRK